MRITRPALALGTATIGLLALAPLGPTASADTIPTYTCEFTTENNGVVHGEAACRASAGAVQQGGYLGPSVVRGYKGPSYNCQIGGVADVPKSVIAFGCTED
ncbi:hypothetical protein AGRA3207_005507 [Actinomadura graeca]|uniref:Secreted protein n=1 Tax=Actinomadura graeca TaxID=2750812 RepID=A0ABX8R1D2_9ACTN|nr:hypothetical protein [Actinomadura graeca]QXJ24229.1 hypothetical protein AGRA3207_005507 [Actinomadura graeca]